MIDVIDVVRRRVALAPRRERDDRGAATVFVVGLSVMLFVVAGLVVDGGLAINARAKAADDAEQAVRAAAQHIDEATLRDDGTVVLNADAADGAARDFIGARNAATPDTDDDYRLDDLAVDGNTVTIEISRTQETALLSLIGFTEFVVRAAAQSEPVVSIDGTDVP